MAKQKQNKIIARCIVAGGTLLAGLGIWTSIINQSAVYQPVAAPVTLASEPNNNTDVAVITDLLASTPLPTEIQTTPAPVTPPAQTTVKTTPAVTKPAVTATIVTPPVVKPPVTTPPPVMTTRGS